MHSILMRILINIFNVYVIIYFSFFDGTEFINKKDIPNISLNYCKLAFLFKVFFTILGAQKSLLPKN